MSGGGGSRRPLRLEVARLDGLPRLAVAWSDHERKERLVLVNWHAHAEPPEHVTAGPWYGRATATIENLLRIHEEAGFDLALVSNPVHYVKGKSPAEALPLIQRANEYAAQVQQRHSDRTVAFATLIP